MNTTHTRIWSGEHKAYVCDTCKVDPADTNGEVLPAQWEDCTRRHPAVQF